MKQALELALEALKKGDYALVNAICEELKQAQPEQEPVAHTLNCVCGAVWDIKADGSEEMVHTPNATPPQRKPLTDEQIDGIASKFYPRSYGLDEFARAIEAAHGIKE